jgi:anti-sigma factor RsiW
MSDTTNHPDEGLIHDFVDDELAGEERARIAAHLAACASCRALADSIVSLREDARRVYGGAGAGAAPDQWSAIDAAIESRRRARSRAPLAAAAAIALLVGSGAVLYATLRGPAADPAPAPVVATIADDSPAAAITVAYAPTLAELERALVVERDRLQPETIATLDANLAILNSAIREIEAALAADPAHRGNLRSLDAMYQTKVNVLQQVVTLASGA